MMKDVLDIMKELRDKGEMHALATVVETAGSVSAKTGSKAVIDQNGRVRAGWVGGGCAESTTCSEALACMASGETTVIDIDLDDEMLGAGMPCGGSMRVYVEPIAAKPTLWIMGHGRVAETLSLFGGMLGMNVVVNDPIADADAFPTAQRLITDDIDYAELKPLVDDYVVIATQHKGDHESMVRALKSDAKYIALIASRKRAGLVMDYLREEGMTDVAIDRVMAPSGLDLGARTPEEIALCVISEIVLVRRGGTGMRMRDKMKLNLDAVEAEQATPLAI